MDFKLTEDQLIIKQAAKQLAEEVIYPVAAENDELKKLPRNLLKKIADLGFMGVLVPEEYNGAGLGAMELTLILEEINRACASTGITLSVHNSLVCYSIVKYGDEDQKKKYLPKLAAGEWLGAYALTEPNAGSDAASLSLDAKKEGNMYILNGTKVMITSGANAEVIIVFARTDKQDKTRGISAFIVEKTFPGFKIGTQEEKMGVCASDTSELIFDNCEVPEENRLSHEGKGFYIAMDMLDGGRIGVAAQGVGIGRACLEASIKYAKERKQFGKAIAEFQSIQWKLSEMAAELDAARLLTYRAAMLRDGGKRCTLEASMAKLLATKTANKAAREAVQIFGGAGYTTEFPVERYYRDARITELYEGTTEIQMMVIARNLLK